MFLLTKHTKYNVEFTSAKHDFKILKGEVAITEKYMSSIIELIKNEC